MHYGAQETKRVSLPNRDPRAWSVFVKAEPSRRTRVTERHWLDARESGAPLLGVQLSEVEAEPAVQA